MDRIEGVSIEDLRRALDEVEGKKATQRLMVAIAYKNGVSQTELAEWYDVQRRTVYSWLKRLEREPLEQAVRDDRRSGRPRKLSESRQERLAETLHDAPTEAGYDAQTWTPALVQRYLDETFGVEYSRPSCRRLMREAGLRYRQTRRIAAEAEADDSDDDREPGKGVGRWIPQ